MAESIGLVAIAKNEGRSIEEWIRFHGKVGFDKFYVYDNASTDNTRDLLNRVSRRFDLQICDWPFAGARYQTSAYEDAVRRFGTECEWMAFLDIDEFLVPVRDRNARKLFNSISGSAAMALNWAIFGSSGHTQAPDGDVTERYTRRAPRDFPPNHHTKMALRPSTLISFRNAHVAEVSGKVVTPDGQECIWANDGVTESVKGFEIARVNHYFVKSRDEWEEKVKRGYSDQLKRKLADFDDYDQNQIADDEAAKIMAYPESCGIG